MGPIALDGGGLWPQGGGVTPDRPLDPQSGFSPDPAFHTGSHAAADWPLSHVRLQDDGRFPWLILIPRRPGLVEMDALLPADRAQLMDELVRASDRVRRLGLAWGRPVDKLNLATLGNVTAQLHWHVVGRRCDDPLWPDPVWGRGPSVPLSPERLAEALALIRQG